MKFALAALLLAAALVPPAGAQCVLDQQQLLYDGGTSARTLPGYTVWQSFTPSVTGTLCEIDMGFFNDMSGEGRLDVLEGDGTAGTVLFSATVPVVGVTGPGVTWNDWPVSVQVTAGATYTFNLTPDAATLPDPYGVAIGSGNPYPAGTMGIDDPSGSYEMPFDVDFRTSMGGGAAPEILVYRAFLPDDVDDPRSVVATVTGSPYAEAAPPAAPLVCWEVDDGAGAPDVIRVTGAGASGIVITWN